MTPHEQKIISFLKEGWRTQMDAAAIGLTLNLSKRLGDMAPKLKYWRIDRRWKATGTVKCKEYRIVRV
jgi:hypothetical protein